MIPNAVVLVMDRLGSGYLGPYGNTWIDTPAWNRLAARSVLFETGIIDTPDLSSIYRSYWHGRHALSARPDLDTPALPERLADSAVETWLVSDERLVAEQAAAQGFRHRVVLPPTGDHEADVVEDTQLARVFATVLDVMQQAQPPFLIWVHAQAMQAAWDAPYDLRAQFAEEDDPDPPHFTSPLDGQLAADYDPDLLLGLQHAYGGQVALLDTCLSVLLDALWSSSSGESTAVVATSSRGFPLGEHRYVGRAELPLFGELVQVPWMTCWPGAAGAMWRVHQIVQPPDLYPTLLNWFGVPPGTAPVWGRSLLPHDLDGILPTVADVACCVHAQQRAVRVPAWFLRHASDACHELYVKPDDRFEFNEISNRCRDVVEELSQVIAQFEMAARADDRGQLPQLPDFLLHGLD